MRSGRQGTSRGGVRLLATLAALAALWVAACSADVGDFHLEALETDGSGGDGSGKGGSVTGPGGRIGGGGNPTSGGRPNTGGAGGMPSTGGTPGGGGEIGGGGDPGAGGDVGAGGDDGAGGDPGTGGVVGAGGDGTGGTTSGGVPSSGGATSGGGPSSGGRSSGGVPSNGGATSGGASNGGTSAGGATSGGASNGGASSGGAGAGGAATWPDNPVLVASSEALSKITAAAWGGTNPERFFLLRAESRQFYQMTTAGVVSGPYAIPGSATVAPRVFGVSSDTVFVATASTIYRLPLAGSTSAAGIGTSFTSPTQISGAWAGGYLLIGDEGNNAPAKTLRDDETTVRTVPDLQEIYGVLTDGQGFSYRSVPSTTSVVNRNVPGTFAFSPFPCSVGTAFSDVGIRGGLFGDTVAWATQSSASPYFLYFATQGTSCAADDPIQFATATLGSKAVGLIGTNYALVVNGVAGTVVQISIFSRIEDMQDGASLTGVSLGTGSPTQFVVSHDSPPRHAILVSTDRPALLRF